MASRRKAPHDLSRRQFLAAGAALAATATAGPAADTPAPRQASGVKVGEVTDTTALVWARLTAEAARNADGAEAVGRPAKDDTPPSEAEARKLRGACPGAPGRIRVRYGRKPDLADARATDW